MDQDRARVGRSSGALLASPGDVVAMSRRRESPTQRALGVLGCFSPSRMELSLTQISELTGLPMSTAHRIVGELAAWGALVRGDNGRYHVGVRLCEVAASSPQGAGLREVAWPYLEDVYEATRECVLLAVRDGFEVVYIARLSGRDAVPVFHRLGRRRAMTSSSAGLLLLAHSPVEIQEEVLRRPLRRYTPKTVTRPDQLRALLADVRRRGYVASDGHQSLSASSCAVPIRGANDQVIGALSTVVHSSEARLRALVPVLMGAARGLSRELGAPSAGRSPGATRRSYSA